MQTEKGISLPDDFAEMLDAQPQLLNVLNQMRPSCQRGYVDWIDAAQDQTARFKRLERAIAKIEKWGIRHALIALADHE